MIPKLTDIFVIRESSEPKMFKDSWKNLVQYAMKSNGIKLDYTGDNKRGKLVLDFTNSKISADKFMSAWSSADGMTSSLTDFHSMIDDNLDVTGAAKSLGNIVEIPVQQMPGSHLSMVK